MSVTSKSAEVTFPNNEPKQTKTICPEVIKQPDFGLHNLKCGTARAFEGLLQALF